MKSTVSKVRRPAPAETQMNCSRCGGWMSRESFEDLRDDTGTLSFEGWRCLFCGEIIDPLILANRKHSSGPIQSKTRKRLIFR